MTPRLRLRVVEPKDEAFLAKLDADPAVMRYIHSGPLSARAAASNARVQIDLQAHRWHFHRWTIELRDESTMTAGDPRIGWIELSKFHGRFDPNENNLSDDISLGYEFDPVYWGRGFAPESALPVLAYAFETRRLPRVVAYTQPENARSARVLEKLGFEPGARTNYKDEGGHECRLFALTASRWRERLASR